MAENHHVNDALQRVGLAALMYYPGIHDDEPGYDVNTDVLWCLEPLAVLPREQLEQLGKLFSRVITDPTANREALFSTLRAIAAE